MFAISFSDAADGVAIYPRGNGTHAITRTADGGHSWATRKTPCGAAYDMYEAVGTAAGSVWMLCGSEPGAGGQAHQVYVSTDHGCSFSLRNGARFLQGDEIGHGLYGAGYGRRLKRQLAARSCRGDEAGAVRAW